LFVVFSLQAAAIGILFYTAREWVTPFTPGPEGERPRVTGGVFADYGASALLAGIVFLTVALFATRPLYRWLGWAAYVGSWWLIVLSETRATMAAAVGVLVIMLHAHRRVRVAGTLVVAGVGIAIVTLLPSLLQEIISVGTRRGEGLDTLSGRTEAFSYLIGTWQESPLHGYGFAAGTRNMLIPFIAREGLNIGSGHDALSTVLVDVGLVGLLLLLTALAAAWLAVWRLYRSADTVPHVYIGAHQIAAVLLWVTCHAIVDKSLAGPYMIYVVAIVAMWALRKQLPLRRPGSDRSAGTVPGPLVAGRRRT
jgi:O-antigen ligase